MIYTIYLVSAYGYNYVGMTSYSLDEYGFTTFKSNLKGKGVKNPSKKHFKFQCLEQVDCYERAEIIEIKYIIREFFWHWNLNKVIGSKGFQKKPYYNKLLKKMPNNWWQIIQTGKMYKTKKLAQTICRQIGLS